MLHMKSATFSLLVSEISKMPSGHRGCLAKKRLGLVSLLEH